MKCVACNERIVEGKRLCPECDQAVKERVDEMAANYPTWFRSPLGRGRDRVR